MTTIDDKINELTLENTSIESKIAELKTKFYNNKKVIKKLEETKELLEE